MRYPVKKKTDVVIPGHLRDLLEQPAPEFDAPERDQREHAYYQYWAIEQVALIRGDLRVAIEAERERVGVTLLPRIPKPANLTDALLPKKGTVKELEILPATKEQSKILDYFKNNSYRVKGGDDE